MKSISYYTVFGSRSQVMSVANIPSSVIRPPSGAKRPPVSGHERSEYSVSRHERSEYSVFCRAAQQPLRPERSEYLTS